MPAGELLDTGDDGAAGWTVATDVADAADVAGALGATEDGLVVPADVSLESAGFPVSQTCREPEAAVASTHEPVTAILFPPNSMFTSGPTVVEEGGAVVDAEATPCAAPTVARVAVTGVVPHPTKDNTAPPAVAARIVHLNMLSCFIENSFS
jgi:hypothetical protein